MEKINKDAVGYYFEKSTIDKNFTRIPNELWGLDIKPMYKVILGYIMSREDYVTNYRICKDCHCDKRTVSSALKYFVENKIITKF